MQPPSVTLRGLLGTDKSKHLSSAVGLRCHVKETKPSLGDFRFTVNDAFVAAGLMPAVKIRAQLSDTTIMTTRFLRTDVINEKPNLRGKGILRIPSFDASDLYPKYEDFAWTTEFPLERLCISELRLKDVWRKGKFITTAYRDIASVSFPGAPTSSQPAGHPDDVYLTAAKTAWWKLPVMPLLIPSTPSTPMY